MNPINTSLKNLAISRQQPKSIEVENKKPVDEKNTGYKPADMFPMENRQVINKTVEVVKPKPVELLKEPEEMATWLQKGIAAVKKVAKPVITQAVNTAGGTIGLPQLGTSLLGGAKAVQTVKAVQKQDVTPVKGSAAIAKAVNNVQTNAIMEQTTNQPTLITKVTENVKKNWMYYLGGLVVAFLVYWFFGKKKVAARRRRR